MILTDFVRLQTHSFLVSQIIVWEIVNVAIPQAAAISPETNLYFGEDLRIDFHSKHLQSVDLIYQKYEVIYL